MTSAILRSVIIAVLLIPHSVSASPETGNQQAEQQALAAEAREIIKQYAGALQKTLKASIMTSGPASAIKTCNVHAPGISQQTAALTGWEISRTSEKVRNPAHRPNQWEAEVLRDFARKAGNGAAIGSLEHFAVIKENGQPVFRYMKAIEVKSLCLNCHGPHVAGPVKDAIDDLYPGDQATGYRDGDLRGAFTLKKPLGSL